LVKNVPNLSQLRANLLAQANAYGNLPPHVRDLTAHEASSYSFGWSHGKEIMNGKPDIAKGSYYANPLRDTPKEPVVVDDTTRYYNYPNVWPDEATCPDFSKDVKALGQLVVHVGRLVARQCDAFVRDKLPGYPEHYLEETLNTDDTTKARLLHYFPLDQQVEDEEAVDSWCGWHLDNSSLTGLVSAMYVNASDPNPSHPTEINCPDPSAGLYIRSRSGELTHVTIPRDAIAFQTGEALQVASGGFLVATPHCVRGCRDPGIARNTFAVFMQPPVNAVLRDGLTFAQFSQHVFKRHYK
jgi:isopenicillin N synthase-like dioxygenase